MEKLYKYEVIDANKTIFADSGDEFRRIWDKCSPEEPSGKIKLTILSTGESRMLYPIKFES